MKNNPFDLTSKVAVITGGGGFLGPKHAEAIIEQGGNVVLVDHHEDRLKEKSQNLIDKYGEDISVLWYTTDITKPKEVQSTIDKICDHHGKIDILINNAARDPKVKKGATRLDEARFETMTPEYWYSNLDAALNGTFFMSQTVANRMLEKGGGVILNISSDLGVIAPDQRIYKRPGIPDDQQPVKPITYSAAKWAVIGMTKYLAVYFAEQGIRVNSLCPTGVYRDEIPDEFVEKLTNLIPMNRMATEDEYKGAIMFLCSNASSYMTGSNVVIDGGKSVW